MIDSLLVEATSLGEAIEALAEAGDAGAPVAGATWIMRAPLRGERPKKVYVSLARLAELAGVSIGDGFRAGALATHAELAAVDGALALIGEAAASSAFPAVRNVATLGGNLAARPFPEADLVPALMAADAKVHVVGPGTDALVSVEEFIETRDDRPAGELITEVVAPTPENRYSAYERLTVRGGGEYAVASVALSVDVGADGVVQSARVAVGCIEETASLSEAGAAELVGGRLDESAAERCGRAAAREAVPREGLDAPGWYRIEVLPALARRAAARIARELAKERGA